MADGPRPDLFSGRGGSAVDYSAVAYEDPFTAVYVVVDEWYQREGWRLVRERPGAKPHVTDSEVLTLGVVRELAGRASERRWYRTAAANWRGLFPAPPERSALHQRAQGLWRLPDGCRFWLRDRPPPAEDPRRLIDGTPVPVCAASRVGGPDGTGAGRQWPERGAQVGRCAARHWWCSGSKLVLTASVDMLPDQAVLVPAAADEREAALALLAPGLVPIGDRNLGRHAAATRRDELDAAGVAFIAPPARRHA